MRTAFAHVGILREAVLGADDVGAESEALPADPAVGPGTRGLQPIEQRQAELLRAFNVTGGARRIDSDQRPPHVVVLGPVHERDVAGERVRFEVPAIENAAIAEQSLRPRRIEAHVERFERSRLRIDEIEELAGPRWREGRHVVLPPLVLARLVDGVILAGEIVHREAARKRLLIARPVLVRTVRLAGDAARLAPGDELGARQRQQVAELGRIHEERRAQNGVRAGGHASHPDCLHAVTGRVAADRLVPQHDREPT
jgi:hypothetical protein